MAIAKVNTLPVWIIVCLSNFRRVMNRFLQKVHIKTGAA